MFGVDSVEFARSCDARTKQNPETMKLLTDVCTNLQSCSKKDLKKRAVLPQFLELFSFFITETDSCIDTAAMFWF